MEEKRECNRCLKTFPLDFFKIISKKDEPLKRELRCLNCRRSYAKAYAKHRYKKDRHRSIESFLSDASFEDLQDAESVVVLRRALKMPKIQFLHKPCLRCHELCVAQYKAGVRQTWHCRHCLNQIHREANGLLEFGLGK